MKKLLIGIGAVLLIISVGVLAQPGLFKNGKQPAAVLSAAGIPVFDHVVVVIEENRSYNEIIGNTQAPYINSLASGGALFTNSYAVTHPSQPNYLAFFSGSTQGITDDNLTPTFPGPDLGSRLNNAGKTFGGYSQGLPSVGSLVETSGAYARKHNPWSDFADVPASQNMPFSGYFPTTFASLPTVSFVIPDLNNDMHDGTIQQADTWLQSNLGAYATWAKNNNSLLIVTWDEDDSSQNNQIPTIFYGANVTPGKYSENVDHYTVLRTIEDMYGLSPVGSAASASTIKDVWSSGTITTTTVPNTPTSLSAVTASASQINLSWTNNATNATGIKIERSTDGINFTQIALAGGSATSWSDSGLAASTNYYYRIKATNSVGDSGYSNTSSATTQSSTTPTGSSVYVSDLTWASATNGWGPVEKDMSNGENAAGDGTTITLHGVTYTKGLGAHAASTVVYNLNNAYAAFISDVGVDDEVSACGSTASVVFQVWADGAKIYDSGVLGSASATQHVNVSVAGKSQLSLIVTDGGDGNVCDHADWAGARLTTSSALATPAAPSNLSATPSSSTQINLTWTNNSTNATGIKVERSTDNINYTQIALAGGTATSWSDTNLSAGTTYYYRVKATNTAGDSAYSNVANASTSQTVPATPSNLSAKTVSSSQISLTWTDNSNNETGFTVQRSPDATTWTQVASLGSNITTWSDSGLTAGTTYYYRVRAANTVGSSAWSNNASAITTSTTISSTVALSSLTWASATAGWGTVQKNKSVGDNTITLNNTTYSTGIGTHAASSIVYNLNSAYSTFTSDVGVDSEMLTCGNVPSVDFQVFTDGTKVFDSGTMRNSAVKHISLSVAGKSKLTLTVTGAGDGITCDHADWAGAQLTTSGITQTTTAPAAPSSLTASSVSTSQINLTWVDNATNETGFKIERSTDGTNFTQTATVGTSVTSWSDSGLAANTKYYYRVRATNSAGDSAYSNVASATTGQSVTVPAAPSNLAASAGSSSQITLTWTDNSTNETGFKVERSTDGTTFTQVATAASGVTTWSDSNLSASTKYYYRIHATNSAGDSSYSNTASATTQAGQTSTTCSGTVLSGNATISSGGTYTGNVTSIKVTTSQPVVIQCVTGTNPSGNFIDASGVAANLTVKNSKGGGKTQSLTTQTGNDGWFVHADGYANIDIENNTTNSGSNGILLENGVSGATIKVKYNLFNNIVGPYEHGNTLMISQTHTIANAEVAWNEVLNTAGIANTEDNINVYYSDASAGNPIWIHDNYIQGAYPSDYSTNTGYSGGGIITDYKAAYVKIDHNTVVDAEEYGIGIAHGHDNSIVNNTVINDQILPSTNIGIYGYCVSGYPCTSSDFYNDTASGNVTYTKNNNNYFFASGVSSSNNGSTAAISESTALTNWINSTGGAKIGA